MKLHSLAVSLVILLAAGLALSCGGGGGGNGTPGQSGRSDVNAVATFQEAAKTASEAIATAGAQAQATAGQEPRETAVPLTELTGTYQARFRFEQRPDDEQLQRALEMPDGFDVAIDGESITIAGEAPFIQVSGTLSSSGAISASGHGAVDPYGEFDASFEGTLTEKDITGTYTLTGPSLPDGSIAYRVTAKLD